MSTGCVSHAPRIVGVIYRHFGSGTGCYRRKICAKNPVQSRPCGCIHATSSDPLVDAGDAVEALGRRLKDSDRNQAANLRAELEEMCIQVLAGDAAPAAGPKVLCKALFSAATNRIRLPTDVCQFADHALSAAPANGWLCEAKNVVHYTRAVWSLLNMGHRPALSVQALEGVLEETSACREAFVSSIQELSFATLSYVIQTLNPPPHSPFPSPPLAEVCPRFWHQCTIALSRATPESVSAVASALAALPCPLVPAPDPAVVAAIGRHIETGARELDPRSARAALSALSRLGETPLGPVAAIEVQVRRWAEAGAINAEEAAVLAGSLGAHGMHPGDRVMRLACEVAVGRGGRGKRGAIDTVHALTEVLSACAALSYAPPPAFLREVLGAAPSVLATRSRPAVARYAHSLARVVQLVGEGARGEVGESGRDRDKDRVGGSGRSEGEGEGQGPGEGEREEQGEGEGEGQGPGGTVDAQWVGREGGGDDLVGDACECLADAVTEWVTSHAWSPPLTRDVARATWAVVRMTPYSTRGFQATRMLDAVAEGCSKAEALECFDTQAMTMLLYSFARASYSSGDIGRSFMTAAADHLTQAQGPLDPPAIGTAMWAFARLGYHPGARCMERLTRCTLDEAALSQFTVQGLCTMLWSTAELASPLPPPRLRRVKEELERQKAGITPTSVAAICSAMSRMAWTDQDLLSLAEEVAVAEARRFSAVGVASTLYGMARVGFYSRDAFAALSARLMDLLPMLTPQQCTNILWAYGATQHYDSAAVTGILDRLHELLHTAVSDSLTAQESPRETWAPLTEEPGRADASEFPSLSEEAWALETASDGFPGQLVAHCLYSCAVLRHDPGLSFVRDASAHVQADLSSFAPSELCMTLWALVTLGFTPAEMEEQGGETEDLLSGESVLETLADRIYSECLECPLTPRDVVQVAWALSAHKMPWHPVMLSTSRRISELSPAAFTALLEGDNESGSSEARMAAAMAEKSLLLVQLCVVEGLSVVAQDALDVTGHAEHQEAVKSVWDFAITLPEPLARAADEQQERLAERVKRGPEGMAARRLQEAMGRSGAVHATTWLGMPMMEWYPHNGSDSWHVALVGWDAFSRNEPRRLGGTVRAAVEVAATSVGVNRFCVVVWGPETRSGDGTAGERGDGNGRQGAVLWADEDVVAVEGAGRVVRCEESEDAADERVEDAPPWWSVIRSEGWTAIEMMFEEI